MNDRVYKWMWIVPVIPCLLFSLNVLKNGFGWDDELIIFSLSPPEIWWDILRPGNIFSYYRPAIKFSYLIDRAIWGQNPFGYHLTVLIFHTINSVLVFFLAKTLLNSRVEVDKNTGTLYSSYNKNIAFPLLSSTLFAVYPVHAESVAWIAGRTDVFCVAFLLSSFILYSRFCLTKNYKLFSASMVLFALALLTKEIAVGFAAMFPLYEFLRKSKEMKTLRGQVFGRIFVVFGILGIYLAVRGFSLKGAAEDVPGGGLLHESLAWSAGFFKVVQALGYYFKVLVWPYPHTPIIDTLPVSVGIYYVGIPVFIISFTAWVWAVQSGRFLYGIFGGWIFLTLAPAAVLPVFGASTTPVAERYLYAPSIGFIMVLAWVILLCLDKLQFSSRISTVKLKVAGYVFIIGLVGVWGWETSARNAVWKDQITFWEKSVAAFPGSGVSHGELGIRYARLGRYKEADAQYQLALIQLEKKYGPDHPKLGKVLHNYADLFRVLGRFRESEALYKKADFIFRNKMGPNNSDALKNLNNLAVLYSMEGRFEEAGSLFLKVYDSWNSILPPNHPQIGRALGNLAFNYSKQGKFAEAGPLYAKGYSILEQNLGRDHPETNRIFENLTRNSMSLGRNGASEELQQ